MSYVHGLNIYKITFMNNGHTHEGHAICCPIVTSSAYVTCLWIECSLLPLYLIYQMHSQAVNSYQAVNSC